MQQGGGIRSRIGKDMLKRFFRVVLMIVAAPIIMMMRVTFPMQRRVGQILRACMIKLHPLTTACEGLEQDDEQQDSGENPTDHDLESWSQILGNVPLRQRTLRVSHTVWCAAKSFATRIISAHAHLYLLSQSNSGRADRRFPER